MNRALRCATQPQIAVATGLVTEVLLVDSATQIAYDEHGAPVRFTTEVDATEVYELGPRDALGRTTFIEYVTDARDRRVGRLVDGVATHGWVYGDQLEPIAEL